MPSFNPWRRLIQPSGLLGSRWWNFSDMRMFFWTGFTSHEKRNSGNPFVCAFVIGTGYGDLVLRRRVRLKFFFWFSRIIKRNEVATEIKFPSYLLLSEPSIVDLSSKLKWPDYYHRWNLSSVMAYELNTCSSFFPYVRLFPYWCHLELDLLTRGSEDLRPLEYRQ